MLGDNAIVFVRVISKMAVQREGGREEYLEAKHQEPGIQKEECFQRAWLPVWWEVSKGCGKLTCLPGGRLGDSKRLHIKVLTE